MTRIQVTIISANEKDRSDMRVLETDSLTSAVRIAHTFKPKRGYSVKKVIIEEVDVIL
jgi:hypothetical protein